MDSQQGSPADGGYETVTSYDQQGFPVAITRPVGGTSAAKHYDNQGFLITTAGGNLAPRSSPEPVADDKASSVVLAAAATVSSSAPEVSKISAASRTASGFEGFALLLSGLSCILGGILFL